jgi:exodeoxyribonuclease-3
MKVATFNANSVRMRLPIILDWLAHQQPDVLAIQETKVEDGKFPVADFEEAGWNVAVHGMKMRNGVAIVSKSPALDVHRGFEDGAWPEDCRLISAKVDGVTIINTYVPNGTQVGSDKWTYKLRWMERFGEYVSYRFRTTDDVVWLGDINIAPTENDLFDPKRHAGGVGFHPDEHARLTELLIWGWQDAFRKFEQGAGHYTYWEFVIPRSFERNLGWRIDHIYLPSHLYDRCKSCVIDKVPRSFDKPSDHTFVIAEF